MANKVNAQLSLKYRNRRPGAQNQKDFKEANVREPCGYSTKCASEHGPRFRARDAVRASRGEMLEQNLLGRHKLIYIVSTES